MHGQVGTHLEEGEGRKESQVSGLKKSEKRPKHIISSIISYLNYILPIKISLTPRARPNCHPRTSLEQSLRHFPGRCPARSFCLFSTPRHKSCRRSTRISLCRTCCRPRTLLRRNRCWRRCIFRIHAFCRSSIIHCTRLQSPWSKRLFLLFCLEPMSLDSGLHCYSGINPHLL